MRPAVVLLTLVLVVLHLTLHIGFGLGGGAPDLLTLGLLIAAREMGMGGAALLGIVLGLLEDALSPLSFGANAAAMAVVGAIGAGTRDLFVGDSPWFGISYLFLGKWLRDTLHWALVGQELREPFTRAVLLDGSLAALYLTVVGVGILSLSGLRWDPSGVQS